jgi:hypothetical protein
MSSTLHSTLFFLNQIRELLLLRPFSIPNPLRGCNSPCAFGKDLPHESSRNGISCFYQPDQSTLPCLAVTFKTQGSVLPDDAFLAARTFTRTSSIY